MKKNPKCLHFRYYIQLCRNIIQDIVWVVEQRKSNIYILLKPSIHNTVGAIGLRLRFSAAQSGQIWHSSSVETKNRSCLIKKILSEAPHLSSSSDYTFNTTSSQYPVEFSAQSHCSSAVGLFTSFNTINNYFISSCLALVQSQSRII